MTRRSKTNCRLRAESLESRQMLHGGGVAIVPPPPAEIAESVIAAHDANEDAMITADEVSERQWSRISAADVDESESVSADELTTHIEERLAERADNDADRGRNGGRGDRGPRMTSEERLDNFFAENDANEDGVLTADEVSEEKWERISEADLDGDGVSVDEILAQREAQRQARFDAAFASLDANEDGGLTVAEVSERRWDRISQADADQDGSVTQQELSDFIEARRAEREADDADEADEGGDTGDGGGTGVGDEAGGQADDVGRRNNRLRLRRGR